MFTLERTLHFEALPPPLLMGRSLVPVDPPLAVPRLRTEMVSAFLPRSDDAPDDDASGRLDFRRMSPRQMANISMDLYAAGTISWDEYSLLAFQPELHPDYDRTVGALVGEKARPDLPRDQVALWEERLRFELKYNPENTELVENTRRIVQVLREIENPMSVLD